MSINTNINRMLTTAVVHGAQIVAAIWLIIDLPWPLIIGALMTHADRIRRFYVNR